MLRVHCTSCYQSYPNTGLPYRCPRCSGLFDYEDEIIFSPFEIEPQLPGVWRFRHTFGFEPIIHPISLGEGRTPLVEDRLDQRSVMFKLEFLNPTGSFKDRGSSLLVSFMASRGVAEAVEDSSGNAGASFAAYTARAGIHGKVFVPDSTAGPKRRQIEAYGVEIIRVMGPRSNASEAALNAARSGVVYASHAYLPFGIPGYATIAYEIFEQLNGKPGTVICPVGQGGLVLGIYRGFRALMNAGAIEELPKIIGVQARACAPLWALYEFGRIGLDWSTEGQTVAEGIRIFHPVRGDLVLAAITHSQGRILAVEEEEILPARDELAHRGFYVEPTSAVVWVALRSLLDSVPEPIVLVLTGSGVKYWN